MIKILVPAVALTFASLSSASALPAAPSADLERASSPIILADDHHGGGHHGGGGHGGHGDWHGGHGGGGHGGRYFYGNRYWGHRYSYQPRGVVGCMAVGPVWYCP